MLTSKASIIARSTVNPLSSDELSRNEIQEQIRTFDQNIKNLIGDFNDVKVRGQTIDEKFPFTDFLMDDEIHDNDDTNILFQETMENGEVFEMPHGDNNQFNDAVKCEIKEMNDAISEESKDCYIGLKVNLPYGNNKR